MKYIDPFLGEIELHKVGETSTNAVGESVVRTVYVDNQGHYYLDVWTTVGTDKERMTIIHRDAIEMILNNERNRLPNGK